jgi:hypothetical protein
MNSLNKLVFGSRKGMQQGVNEIETEWWIVVGTA